MPSSHCILPQLHLSFLLHNMLHLERSGQSPFSHPNAINTPASSYNSSPAAVEPQQSRAPIRDLTLRVCTAVVRAPLVTAEVEVTSCCKSSPFGCCLILQRALGLLCVKCQVHCLACLPIPLPALLGALPAVAK